MNKVVAEILAGVIPQKMARNRWRGILRFGPINAIKLMFRIRRDKTQPKYQVGICAIAKDEGPYFKEWIEWHQKIGVEKFYIYDNDSTDDTKEILRPYVEAGIVEYTFFPGFKKQLESYDDCLKKHRFDTRWIAFIDLDEFIVPIKDKSLPEFLKRFEEFPAVEVNWLIFGSGGEKRRLPGTMMQRFRYHSQPDHILNRHVKSIVNPRMVFSMIGCHEVARISGKAADSHGNPITKNYWNREPQQDIIRINHYAVRSYEEFKEKQDKGRAAGKTRRISDDYFTRFDLNDIKDELQYE